MDLAQIDARFHIDRVGRAWDLLLSEEDTSGILTHALWREVNTESVVLVICRLDRHIKTPFISKSNGNVPRSGVRTVNNQMCRLKSFHWLLNGWPIHANFSRVTSLLYIDLKKFFSRV